MPLLVHFRGAYAVFLLVTSVVHQLARDVVTQDAIRGFAEACVPLLFVDLITSLTRCGDKGWAAKLCQKRCLLFYSIIFYSILLYSTLLCYIVLYHIIGAACSSWARSRWPST